SSGAGRTSDGNGSHASTLKSPSYTKSVSWQHYPKINIHTELCQAAMVAVKENQDQPFLHLEREVRKAVKERALEKIKLFGSDGKAE
ncbi:class II fructose-bisphosphate aldolase, partial [Escherichia coli]